MLPILLLCSATAAAQNMVQDATFLRGKLQDSVGNIPWNPHQGYRLSGQFVHQETGGEVRYSATYVRVRNHWVADFSQEDASLNMRYALTGSGAWAASPEATVDVRMEELPYCARYDFAMLYHELLKLLEEGSRNPLFKIERDANDVYIRGKLRNGEEATFHFNTGQYFPRKVSINITVDSPPSWCFVELEADGAVSLVPFHKQPDKRFEVWFSDPGEFPGYRYPRRTDYAEGEGVIGSFFLKTAAPVQESDPLLTRPPKLPWAEGLDFTPGPSPHRTSLYLKEADLPTFRARLNQPPWAGWFRINRLAAAWGRLALPVGSFFPIAISFLALASALASALVIFLVWIWRLRRKGKRRTAWLVLLGGGILWGFVLISGTASMQLSSQKVRSVLALQIAIHYAATGNPGYGHAANRYLEKLALGGPPASILDLSHACQAYSLVYDLISPLLTWERQKKIESDLFSYAKPLYGSMHGWRSNSSSGSVMSAGLGMVGLAIGSQPYLKAALRGIERTFQNHLDSGLHREGPGHGCYALDNLANFMYALKRTGNGDFYGHPRFQEYIETTIQLLSPLGTLPLFGDTSLDHAIHLTPFLLKVAGHVPTAIGSLCVSVRERYWRHGQYSASGWRTRMSNVLRPHVYFLVNPYPLFQYEEIVAPAAAPPGSSAVLAHGQATVLRSGSSPDSLYLAMNLLNSGTRHLHRDILTFDLYAYESLLLHGPGFAGSGRPGHEESIQTAASNSVTFNDTSQSATQCTGVVMALLNQPGFDFVRALADKTYDHGQVQRDVVMVRPEKDQPGYFLLIDEIHTNDPLTKVGWHLHGRGKLATGINFISRWTTSPFASPGSRSADRILVAYPLVVPGSIRSTRGKLYFESSRYNQNSEGLIVEWEGSKRFCTVLFPRMADQPEPKWEILAEGNSGRLGDTDWVSLSDLTTRRTTGPLTHVSEYSIVRERKNAFPSLLMVQGLEIRLGPHSILSTKPVTISLDGLRGGLLNPRPDTRLEFRSPEIRPGDRFLLDGELVTASPEGVLSLVLQQTGEHSVRRAT